MMYLFPLVLGLAVALASVSPSPAAAQPVDAALVFAIDVSRSVNAERYELQHEGIARAFEDSGVAEAIAAGPQAAIAALVMEWSDRDKQVVTVDWTRIADRASAREFAARVRASERSSDGLTAIGDALLAARASLERLPYSTTRRIINLSGDGIANAGPQPREVRDFLVREGITVHGLAILSDEPRLGSYYIEYVVGGTGAFLITVEDFQSFASAMLSKLLGEIAGLQSKSRFAVR
jgi:hypothetical protein